MRKLQIFHIAALLTLPSGLSFALTVEEFLADKTATIQSSPKSEIGPIDEVEVTLGRDINKETNSVDVKIIPNTPSEYRLRQTINRQQNDLEIAVKASQSITQKKVKMSLLCQLAYWQDVRKIHWDSLKYLDQKQSMVERQSDNLSHIYNLPKIAAEKRQHVLDIKSSEYRILEITQEILHIANRPLTEPFVFDHHQLIDGSDLEKLVKSPENLAIKSENNPEILLKKKSIDSKLALLDLDVERNQRFFNFVEFSFTPAPEVVDQEREIKIGFAFPISSRKSFDQRIKRTTILADTMQIDQDQWKELHELRMMQIELRSLLEEYRDLETAIKKDNDVHHRSTNLSAYSPLILIEDNLTDLEMALRQREVLREARLMYLQLTGSPSPKLNRSDLRHFILKPATGGHHEQQ